MIIEGSKGYREKDTVTKKKEIIDLTILFIARHFTKYIRCITLCDLFNNIGQKHLTPFADEKTEVLRN